MWFGGLYGIITSKPSNLEFILRTRFSNFPKGKYFRERFTDLLGDGIFNADDDVWREQRRAAASEMHSLRFAAYSADSITSLVHQKLLHVIAEKAEKKEIIDLQEIFLRFTFDNICVAAFGVDPGCVAVDLPEIRFAKAFERATELTLFRFIVPPFVWKIMREMDVGPEKELKEAVSIVQEFAGKTLVDRRKELSSTGELSQRSDLLSRLVEAKDGDNFRFSDNFIKDFCISFILAGRDTSSVALAWFFWIIHARPDVENEILLEIDAIIAQRGEKEAKDVVFTVEELGKMEYLQSAISEALRLYPSVPVDFKEAVEDDVLPDGTRVKKGARVIYSIYSMGRTEDLWGKDCTEYKPERWMKKEGGKLTGENQFNYPVFNAGPRLCLGKKFAYLQMKMVTAAMILRYKVKVVKGQVVEPKLNTTLYMKNGLLVTFEPRERSSGAGV